MKRISQYLMLTGLSGLLCLFLAIPADAQRGGGHSRGGGGGGSSSRGGGGGGGSFSRGGGGGGGNFSRGGGESRFGGGVSRGNAYSGGASRGNTFSGGASRGNSYSNRSNGGFSQQYNASPRLGMQGRGGSLQGNTRSFSRGGSFNGNRGYSYNGRIGINGDHRGAGVARSGFYRGGHYYGGGYSRSFGYNYSPWRTHGGYFYNRGFYRSSYYPRLGVSLGILPYGYYPFLWGDNQFYYSGGYFYQYDNDQYTVVEPPIGAAVNSLPNNAQPININGQQYYELNGVYYLPITRDDGTVVYQVAGKDGQLDTGEPNSNYNNYDNNNNNNSENMNDDNGPAVAGPQIGDMFYSLPPDSRKVKLGGVSYFVSPDDYYYQETRDTNNDKAYKVVGTPDNAPGN